MKTWKYLKKTLLETLKDTPSIISLSGVIFVTSYFMKDQFIEILRDEGTGLFIYGLVLLNHLHGRNQDRDAAK